MPAPKVNWQKDGVSCDNNPDYVISLQQGLCTLTIEETMVEDSGTFTCRAWNSAGVTQSCCRLTVRGGERWNVGRRGLNEVRGKVSCLSSVEGVNEWAMC